MGKIKSILTAAFELCEAIECNIEPDKDSAGNMISVINFQYINEEFEELRRLLEEAGYKSTEL